jgi:hypothetical protein
MTALNGTHPKSGTGTGFDGRQTQLAKIFLTARTNMVAS